MFWRFEKKGHYSVRDGYRLQRGLFLPPEYQSEYPIQKWWSFIWSLSLPPKVRIFWWRLSHDIIPTNKNLLSHHVPVKGTCQFCNLESDTTCHSLFFCATAKRLWKETEYYQVMKIAKAAGTLDLCDWMRKQLPRGEFEKFAILTWAVWKAKLDCLHGDGKTLNDMHIRWSEVFLAEFKAARLIDKITTKPKASNMKWRAPDMSALKINVDACVNENQNRYSVGGVLRDKQDRLIMAFGKQISKPISVLMGELEAILEATKILNEMKLQDVQIATDSLLAVQAVTICKEDIGYEGLLAAEINNLMHKPMISDLIHENRLANSVAHHIALFSSSYCHSSFVWVNGQFSSWLVNLVILDLS